MKNLKRNSKLNKGIAARAMKVNAVSYKNIIRKIMKPQYDMTPVVYKMYVEKTEDGSLKVTNMVMDEETGKPRFQYGIIGNSKAVRRLPVGCLRTKGKVSVEEVKDDAITNFKVQLDPKGRYKFFDSIVMVKFGEGIAESLLNNGFKVSEDGIVTINDNTPTDEVYDGPGFEFGTPCWGPTNEKHRDAFFYNIKQRSRDEWFQFSDSLTGGAFDNLFDKELPVQKALKAVTRWGNYMTGSVDGPSIDLTKDYVVVILREQNCMPDFEAPKGMDPGTNIQDGGSTVNAAIWVEYLREFVGIEISEEDCCKLSPQCRFDIANSKTMDNIEDNESMKYRERMVEQLYGITDGKVTVVRYGNTNGRCAMIIDTDGAKLVNEDALINASTLRSVVLAFAKTNTTTTSSQLMDKYTKKDEVKAKEILTQLYQESLEEQVTNKVESYFDPNAGFADNMLSLMGTNGLNYKEVAKATVEDLFKFGVKAISRLKVKMDSLYSHVKFDSTFIKTGGKYGYTLYVKYLPGYGNYAVEAFNPDILDEKAEEIAAIENDDTLSDKEKELALDALLTCIMIKYPSACPDEYEIIRYVTRAELAARLAKMDLDKTAMDEMYKYWNRAAYGVTVFAPINILKNRLAGMDIDYDACAADFSLLKEILIADKSRVVDFILYQKDLDKLNLR